MKNRNRNRNRNQGTVYLDDLDKTSLMQDEVLKQDDEDRYHKLQTLIRRPVEEPFPYVGENAEGFLHLRLPRPSTGRNIRTLNHPITQRMFDKTIHWLKDNLWFNRDSYVHGDLTESNIIATKDCLWIIDFEPGLFVPAENKYQIYLDYVDFIRAVETNNKRCEREKDAHVISLNEMTGHSPEEMKGILRVYDKLNEAKDSPVPGTENFDTIHFHVNAHLTHEDEEIVARTIEYVRGNSKKRSRSRSNNLNDSNNSRTRKRASNSPSRSRSRSLNKNAKRKRTMKNANENA